MLKVDTRDLRLMVHRFDSADVEIRRAISEESKRWAPTLVRAAQSRAHGEVEKKIAKSAQTKVTAKGLVATFGASGRVGRTPLRELTRPYEFGTIRPEQYTTYRSRRNGKALRVTRRTQRQIPPANSDGRFIYPALAATTPKLVARYVRAVAEAVTDA